MCDVLSASNETLCAICGRLASRKCRHCKAVPYCSQECKLWHWRCGGHKFVCKDFCEVRVTSSAQNGLTPSMPVQPTPSMPVQPTPCVPVQPTPRVPVQPTPRVPVQPTPRVPVQPTPSVPVQPTPAVPVQPTPIVSTSPLPVRLTPSSADHNVPNKEVQRDDSGRVIIRLVGKGWTPNHYASQAIDHVIRSQFRGPYHHYEAVIEKVLDKGWMEFKSRVTWASHDDWPIGKIYEAKVRKRLCDKLTKARVEGIKPDWISEQAWIDLLNYWDTQKFKGKSSRNKINRYSYQGGAMYTTKRKSHLDVALDLESYHGCSRTIQSNSSEGSSDNLQQIHPTKRIRCWKEVTGGKTGRCYGTGDFTANLYHGVSSFTQPPILGPFFEQSEQQLAAETERLREEVKQATERANEAIERANEAIERCKLLEDKTKFMQRQLTMVFDQIDSPVHTSEVYPELAEDFNEVTKA